MKNKTHRGLLLVISSPSGVGKTSIVNHLLRIESDLSMSVSVTTRPKRAGEIDGKDYHFVSQKEFQALRQQGSFMEYAEVYGNYYGTPRDFVLMKIENGFDMVFDIDWQGAQQLAQLARHDLVSIFVLPPSIKELGERLHKRGLDSPEIIEKRLSQTINELSHWAEYDYVIINTDLEESVYHVQRILQTERLKRIRQPHLINFVQKLCQEKL